MATAARAIILQDNKILVMRRNKQSGDYYTLVGGRVKDGELPEQGLVREVKEETGLDVTGARLVFTEDHRAPYNDQLVFLCEIIPREDIAIQEYSEEAALNKHDFSIHEPLWVPVRAFSLLPFRTPQLQTAITQALSRGFPSKPIKL